MKSLPNWINKDNLLVDDPDFLFVFEPFEKEEYDVKEYDISGAWLMEPFMDEDEIQLVEQILEKQQSRSQQEEGEDEI
jgi:hypothetical protein